MTDEIIILPYSPLWPILFEQEAEWLRNTLPYDLPLDIEHIGSTAIPGMEAKPVIDILVSVSSMDRARGARKLMEGLDYVLRADEPEHLNFVKGLPGPRTHHVHFRPREDAYWDHILFRDYLRTHLSDADAYVALKRELAARFRDDRPAYVDGKTEFVKAILEKAQAEIHARRWDDDDD